MDLNIICEKLKDRIKKADKVLADSYNCVENSFAIVEVPFIESELTPKEIIEDVETAFYHLYLPLLERQLEVDADYVPDIDLFHGTVLIAAAFGSPVEFPENGWPWARPVLTSIKQVDYLELPDLKKVPVVQRFFEQIRWLQDETDNRIPIKLMDLQSPFTTATQIRHYEDLLIDMIDEPNRVKKLLEIITEISIRFLELQKEVYIYSSYPGRNFPGTIKNLGICIADDSALIPLSSDMYEEFCLPTMLKIANNVSGIFLHSCGDYNHQMDNLLKIPNLKAVQIHSGPGEIDPLPSWRKIRGRVSLYSDTNNVSLGDKYKDSYWDCYNEYVLPRLLEDKITGLVLLSPPVTTKEERQSNIDKLRNFFSVLSKAEGEY